MYLNKITIDPDKCIGCGLCNRACPGMLLYVGDDNKTHSRPFEELNWSGCWRCQHCLQVCPKSAISVFDKKPEDSLPMWPKELGPMMDKLVSERIDCEEFKSERIDTMLEDKLFKSLTNAPTGGNKMKVVYTVIDGDPLNLGVPHLFIPHAPANDLKSGSPIVEGEDMVDVSITTEYFDLLANAHGLGTKHISFPVESDARKNACELFGIPEEHVVLDMIAFGYPEKAQELGLPEEMGSYVDSLIAGRNSCRHYKQENVDDALRNQILAAVKAAVPDEFKDKIEFTIYDDIEKMNALRSSLREAYFKMKADGILPYSWTDERIAVMESREDLAMNGDMFFCSVPHIIMAHMPKAEASAPVITSKALTDFELLSYSHGLGAIYLGYAFNVMRKTPEVKKSLGIPEDHFMINAVGFGYPLFRYQRGRQKDCFVKIERKSF